MSPLKLALLHLHGTNSHFQKSVCETRGLALIQGFLLVVCLFVAHLTLNAYLRSQRYVAALVIKGLWVKPWSMNEQELHFSRGSQGWGLCLEVVDKASFYRRTTPHRATWHLGALSNCISFLPSVSRI